MRVAKKFVVRPLQERSVLFSGRFEGLMAALCYGISSASIIIFNKTVFSTFGFRSPVFVCLVHMMLSFTLVVVLKAIGRIDYQDFDLKIFIKMIPLSICFVGNILLGLLGTRLISVPMFTTLRRLTALFILILTFIRTSICPSVGVTLSVSLLIAGAAVAGYNDLYFDPKGYLVVILNNMATTGYLQITKDVKEEVSKFGLLFYNSMISIPMLLIWVLLSDELTYVAQFENRNNVFFQLFFVLGGAMAFFVNVTTAWCTQANGPLTTSITGQTKNILTTILGALLFDDFAYDPLLVAGIIISIFGSFTYAYIKYTQMNETHHLQK